MHHALHDQTPTQETITVKNVSGRFVDDHIDRAPDGEPLHITGFKGTMVTITGTRKQMESLHSDAAFYADPHGPDMLPDGLKASAVRIRNRLAKLGFAGDAS